MSPEAVHGASSSTADKYPAVSSWIGWIAFAAVGMLALGAFHVMLGLVVLLGGELGADPVRSLLMIVLDIVVIMALTVHGSDVKP